MRRTAGAAKTGVLAVALLVGACGGGSDSIAGTYDCGPDGAALEVWELREDGTLTINAPDPAVEPVEATWDFEGDEGVVHVEGSDDPFTLDGDRLVFGGPENWACVPQG